MKTLYKMLWTASLTLGINGCLISLSASHPLTINGKPVKHIHSTQNGHSTAENKPTEAGHFYPWWECFWDPIIRHYDLSKQADRDRYSRAQHRGHPNATMTGDPTVSYNCHGYTFSITEGWTKCWIEDPETVIKEGHYVKIPKKFSHHWKYCDIVVYRKGDGTITHTGHVKEVVDGQITKMRSKWGCGAEWEHTPDDIPPNYTADGGGWEVRRKCGMCINEYEYRGDGKYHVNERIKVIKVTGIANVSVGDILEPCSIVEVQSGTVRVVPVEDEKLRQTSGAIRDCPGDYTSYTDIIDGSYVLEEYGTCDITEHCGGYTPLADFWVDVTPDTFITAIEVTHDSVENYTLILNSLESPHDIVYSPRVGPDSGVCFTLSPGSYVEIDSNGVVPGPYAGESKVPFYHGLQRISNFGAIGNDDSTENFIWYGTNYLYDGSFISAVPVEPYSEHIALDVYNCEQVGFIPSQHLIVSYDEAHNANVAYANFYTEEDVISCEYDSLFVIGIMQECTDFVIKIKIYYNPTPTPIPQLYVGLYEDWDIGDSYSNAADLDSTHNLMWMWESFEPELVFGMMKAPFYDHPMYNMTVVRNPQYVYPNNGFCSEWGLDSLYYLMTRPGYYNHVAPDTDLSLLMVPPPFSLNPGEKHIEVWFNFGRNLNDGLTWKQWRYKLLRYAGFYRGEVNWIPGQPEDPILDLGDVVYLINYLYKQGPAPLPYADQGDVNADGIVDLGDLVYMINYIFKGGPPPIDYVRFIEQLWSRPSLFLNPNW